MSSVVRIRLKGRLSYPSLFVAKQDIMGEKAPVYSADILFPKTDTQQFNVIDQARREAGLIKFPTRSYESLLKEAKGNQSLVLKDGDEKVERDPEKYQESYKGMWYISSTNTHKPTLVDQQAIRVTEDTGLFYAGCHVLAIINIYCYFYNKMKRGFSSTLAGVQFLKDDKPWQGKRIADIGEFEPIEELETVSSDDPF
ncbi:ssDNA-binding protein [Candidatus Liberibacter brunswickensis]|uniref:ssDNA-binding protein n=1 Tax=Candidatus Liberibacter brunswickensis TaxID=1968796 RepID=UPI002FDF9055